jgi:hypothetical protein
LLARNVFPDVAACKKLEELAYHCSSLTTARPKGHHCPGNKSLGSDTCPTEAETDVKIAVHQAADCIMLPSEGVSREYCPYEGSQMGHVDIRMKSMWVSRMMTAYKGYSPIGLLSLFTGAMI